LLDNNGLTVPVNSDVTLDGNTLFIDASTDRVGIGTSSPDRLFHLADTEPTVVFDKTNEGVDEKKWRIYQNSASLQINTVNDAFNAADVSLAIDRTGNLTTQHRFFASGSHRITIDGSGLSASNAAGPALLNEAASLTNPTLVPNRADTDTGIGWVSADIGSLVAGGSEVLRFQSGIVASVGTDPKFYLSDTGGGTAGDWSIWNTDDSFRIRDENTGADRVIVDSSGKVGIGTSAPENPMTIQDIGGSTFNRDFSIRNGDATNYHRLILGYNAGSVASGVPANAQFLLAEKGGGYGTSGGLVVGNSDNAPVIFTTNATERMRIDSSGNVTTTGDMFIDRDGGTVAAWLNIDATNGYQTGVRLLTAGVKRWEIGTHEASALEDFVLRSYNDAGGGVIETMYITRSNSAVSFVGSVSLASAFTAETNYFYAANPNGPMIMQEAASSTNPTLVPNRQDTDTGIGWNAADELSVIAGGTEVGRWFNSGLLMYGQLRVPDGTFGSGGLVFYNDLDTGIYRPAADSIAFATGGDGRLTISTTEITSGLKISVTTATGPALMNEAASATNPTLVPNRAAPTYGIGAASATAMSLIGGGVEVLRWNSTTLLAQVPLQNKSYTVAGLPAGGPGATVYASDGRKAGEGPGAGTGVLVFNDGANWIACDTGATVAA
jgi:hypothetical protein